MLNRLILIAIFLLCNIKSFSQNSDLSVEKIMQDPSWIGTFPEQVRWGIHGENIYFKYNPEGNPADSLYRIAINESDNILKVTNEEAERIIPVTGDFNKARSKMVYTNDGRLMLYNLATRNSRQLIDLPFDISSPIFSANDANILFQAEKNAFSYDLKNGSITQLTNIKTGKGKTDKNEALSAKDQWVRDQNLELLEVVRQKKEKRESSKSYRESIKEKDYIFYTEDKELQNLEISPNGKFAAFSLIKYNRGKSTDVPNYVDESGYTKDLKARSKVGEMDFTAELAVYDIAKDTVYFPDLSKLPEIDKLPDYVKDYPEKEWTPEVRKVIPSSVKFSDDGKKAIVNLRSTDNKDRWIALLDLDTGDLKILDNQRDEAWLAGPGIGYTYYGYETLGWLPDNEHIYFQSEASGYSHLYLVNVKSGKKTQLTKGEYEVFDPMLSNDGKFWYLTASKVHPGERHFYKMPAMGGKMQQLTSKTGNNQVKLTPNEKYMAITYSYMNRPDELYLKEINSNAAAVQLTNGQSEEFKSYKWKEPQLIEFKAQDGEMVPARLYLTQEEVKNDAAVVFVHGAGYLQNAHKWWSSYFREYMFHNLLTDLGYTVIDIDYRGSAGYGRDWRTGIYRHMGGKDLSDQVDGVKYLLENHDIDPNKVGIYGGSYGGFITLMAMFTEAETFKAGAALRSVTDWAHYNHGYTSNILNEPSLDPIAYRRSSPIYFAEGLEGDLLIAHGMLDVNVHFQDVVRLVQRLIELGKENWELAVFPVEDHGFTEPSSWTDEYRRILNLFNESLLEE
ncbi:prolyl oligopeptidase family serine peptidase [Christiangramia aquimixticola]|uniref:S9 family peptidase n=1 Tax=Christiangramia aquimixticola TaxID=1697558 RepID=UPI003AA98C75